MDSISETPLKRRKGNNGRMISSQGGYDSQNDSGEDLFDEDTVDTILLPPMRKGNTEPNSTLASYPISYTTQPTQLIEDTVPCSPLTRPSIQVAASSPTPHSASSPLPPPRPKVLPHIMAPPGTNFRMPPGVKPQPAKEVIELSDDDEEPVRYVGASSDDDTQSRSRDIKPSVMNVKKTTMPATGAHKATTATADRSTPIFSQTMKQYVYKPGGEGREASNSLKGSVFDSRNRADTITTSRLQGPKRSAPTLAGAYGASTRDAKKQRQSGPSRAAPVVRDLKLEDIGDFSIQAKVGNMKAILTEGYTNQAIYDTLMLKNGNVQDALDYLTSQEPSPPEADLPGSIDLTMDNDDYSGDQLSKFSATLKKPATKQQLKAPVKSLTEKYASAQAKARSLPQKPSPPPVEQPRRRKLVQGRRKPQVAEPGSSSPIAPVERAISVSDDDEPDSAIASSDSDASTDHGTLLRFFNTCSVADLVDLSSTADEIAELLVANRPYKSLAAIRQVTEDNAAEPPTKKRGAGKRPIGDKIVDICEKMWAGYEAVEQLVDQCQTLSEPVAQEMKAWGVDVYGGSNTGELEIVELDEVTTTRPKTPRDSGIATPASATISGDEDNEDKIKGATRSKLFQKPSAMEEGVVLKGYQVIGMNWLALLYKNGLSCILADDMGLGKTCQVIAFLAHLFDIGQKGPHLIVVPASVIENWMREFETFCSVLHVLPYHGSQADRQDMQYDIAENMPNVIVTTYSIAQKKDDRKFLSGLDLEICVYDEGHMLKNQNTKTSAELRKLKPKMSVLLTGTPLQNNLGELTSLLGFILPSVFRDHKDDLQVIFAHKATTHKNTHGALLSEQRISKAKKILTPFILRRKKQQVLKQLPKKTKRTEFCEMTEWQAQVYTTEWQRSQKAIQDRAAGDKDAEKPYNVQMVLRKAAIHPSLLRHSFSHEVCKHMCETFMKAQPEGTSVNPDLVMSDLEAANDHTILTMCHEHPPLRPFLPEGEPWMNSGKVGRLVELCKQYKANGDRALVFTQMRIVMDILEDVFSTAEIKFYRFDGTTKVEERQDLIDAFYKDLEATVFMVSTKAGGAGINLACANKVIIFDSSYNPQDDIQAENRAHRVGQTRDVEVVKLVTRGTIEEDIHELGETKLALDEKVAGTADGDEVRAELANDHTMAKQVEEMLKKQMREKR